MAQEPEPGKKSSGVVWEEQKESKGERVNIVDEVEHDGLGGPLAVENEHGLIKAFAGDTVVTLSNGKKFVVFKEVRDAAPLSGEAKARKEKEKTAKEKKRKEQEEEAKKLTKEQQEAAEKELTAS